MNTIGYVYCTQAESIFDNVCAFIRKKNKDFIAPVFSESEIEERKQRLGIEVKDFNIDIFIDLKQFNRVALASLKKDFVNKKIRVKSIDRKASDIAEYLAQKMEDEWVSYNSNLT